MELSVELFTAIQSNIDDDEDDRVKWNISIDYTNDIHDKNNNDNYNDNVDENSNYDHYITEII